MTLSNLQPEAPAAAVPVPAPGRRRLRRLLRGLGLGTGTVLLLVLAGVAWVATVGITVDASALRPALAQAVAEAIGRQVEFEGPAELELSGRPWLRIGGLRVSDPGGFTQGTLLSLGEARLAVDLWALLRQRLHVRELAGRDLTLRLEARPDGGNNWSLAPPGESPPETVRTATDTGEAARQARDAALMLDIRNVSLERIKVEFRDGAGPWHYFDLDRLSGSAPRDQPIALEMKGRVEKSFPYQIRLSGAPLRALFGSHDPWPFDFQVEFLGSVLRLDGALRGTSGELGFAMGSPDLTQLERLLQTPLPKVGAGALAGRVTMRPGYVAVTGLSAVLGRTALQGWVAYDAGGARPALRGKLDLPTLDLRPFLTGRPTEDDEPPRSLRDLYRELAEATFSLRGLRAMDVDLDLAVSRWLSLPGDVHDATLELHLQDGVLDVPLAAVVAEVPLAGRISADGRADPPRFGVSLGTRDSPLGGLAEFLVGARGLAGHLGRFSFDVTATGDSGRELVSSLDVRLAVADGRLSYGNVAGGRPVAFALDRLAVDLPAGRRLAGRARGNLIGQPFQLTLDGGSLERVMLDQRTPLDLRLRSGSARARIHGTLAPPAAASGPALAFEVSAERTDDVAQWFGTRPGASARFELRGRAAMTETLWRVDDLALRLGRTALQGALSRQDGPGPGRVALRLHATDIDIAQLRTLLPVPPPRPAEATPSRPVLQIPILPHGIDLGDADVAIRVDRVSGTPLEPRAIAFDGRIRDGAMQPSPFSAVIAGVPFQGAVSLDLRGAEPSSALWLATGRVDIGALLRRLGLARDLEISTEGLRIALSARSSLLGDLLARSELIGNLDDTTIVLRDPNGKGQARIFVDGGELSARPGRAVRLDLDGRVDASPVRIALETAPAVDLVRPEGGIPFRMDATLTDLSLRLQGELAKPVGTRDLTLGLDLRGPRLDRLDSLARASLPPWGPYALTGRFRMGASGYEVSDLTLAVGGSALQGRGSLRTDLPRPHLEVALRAPTVQLDDFRLGEWSPVEKKAKPDKAMTAEQFKARAASAGDEAQRLLSREVLARQDVDLSIEVDQVLSGQDRLGSGRLLARLKDGRADIGPVEVRIPGGSASLRLGYAPTATDVSVDLKLQAERFDYGVLARRLKPGTDLSGEFSLDVEVASRTGHLSDILEHGNGRIDFAVWPRNMKSGVFDLWAVNVLVALVPAVDPASASRINCAIGRFQLTDGRLRERAIIMDTTRMRVTGRGSADFHDESVHLRLQPRAKKAQFLSLATPVEVHGRFGDFKVGVSAGDVLGSLGRFATSIFWVPLQRLASQPLPADGQDVCGPGLAGR